MYWLSLDPPSASQKPSKNICRICSGNSLVPVLCYTVIHQIPPTKPSLVAKYCKNDVCEGHFLVVKMLCIAS